MKKLKTLGRILTENPDCKIDRDGTITHRNWTTCLLPSELWRLGGELQEGSGFIVEPSWIEGDEQGVPMKVEGIGYYVTSRKQPGIEIRQYAAVLTKEDLANLQALGIHARRAVEWDIQK